MDKSKNSQILKLCLIVMLLIITPHIPTSLRPTYLYFVFNLLIIALGAEAGLLSFFSKAAAEDKKAQVPLVTTLSPKPPVVASESTTGTITPECAPNKAKVVEKCLSDKVVGTVKAYNKVKKCPSTPSLFFIGGGEAEAEEMVEVDDVEEEEEEGEELYTKAETFIGNFYKQLKMQREESWKRIHGFYHKAF